MEVVAPFIQQALEVQVSRLESDQAMVAWAEYQLQKQRDKDGQAAAAKEKQERALQDAKIDGGARSYQISLLETCKKRNSIVYLGTGSGKTLIAILLVKELAAAAFAAGKQTLFLVPSVALALQQSTTLQANLPHSVGLACYSVTAAAVQLRSCNILVATHGAFLELLQHHGDMFAMANFNLLILDECHYCTGNHDYALIMRDFYHATPQAQRPRVLGLTASPLINVKANQSDEQLAARLSLLEATLDAKMIPLADIANGNDQGDDIANLMQKETNETTVTYQGTSPATQTPLAISDDWDLHPFRRKEFRQLEQLYTDLGPLVVSIYASSLIEELFRNTFEKESVEQFNRAIQYLEMITGFCKQECSQDTHDGRTDKMRTLEDLLEREMVIRHDAVGLVLWNDALPPWL